MLQNSYKFLLIIILFIGSSSNRLNEEILYKKSLEGKSDLNNSKAVDFGELVVETSWISKDKRNRDTFKASEIDDKEWMDVYDNGIVKMTCLAPKSHRTELKENAGVESSLNTFKKMEYTATLKNIPYNGVTIAQIHNRGGVKRPWIRVYVDDDRHIKIKATETTPDEKKSTYSTYVGPLYTAESEFSINITTQNGLATFEIKNEGTSFSKTLSPSSDWNKYKNNYYLKAGVYTEGNDVEPILEISAFSILYK
ncbi:polysaccharide lyase family 7 protein [Polaribacter porphyrae]|uniref:Alginate lyase 2 domain-containing protein n=1 Tax=Polaribacter porphyrae TaxID=1137780 RepID=A0A2S7WRP1_9FLAO|nr:polysaccharide lyase family 7 protein [Polaribacter porphyrae]PQJ80267.1 hypothetical protein BTO18_14240 [Polaribacter porphyrae]